MDKLIKLRDALHILQSMKHQNSQVFMDTSTDDRLSEILNKMPRKLLVEATNEIIAMEELLNGNSKEGVDNG